MGFQLLPHKFIRSMDTRLDSDQGCPNLNQERVLAGPHKTLHFQVLLEGLKKQFNLPAVLVGSIPTFLSPAAK